MIPKRKLDCSPEALMNETPSVIGMMSVTMSSGGSFDTAVREIAKNGPKHFSKMFSEIVLDADCRSAPDIKRTVSDRVSGLPKQLSPFKRAMHIVTTAFETSDLNERRTMMKDAESIVLEGLRSMGETYSSSLNSPCLVVFGLGIMLPMILISMLPMLSMGGLFSVSLIDSQTVSMIVLVVIPIIVGSIAISLRGRNPFFKAELLPSDMRFLLPMVTFIPVYLVCSRYGLKEDLSMAAGFAVAGLVTFSAILPSIIRERERAKTEESLKDILFELGNRLSMGENFENAMKKAFESKKDCLTLSYRIEREFILCRGDTESALRIVLNDISPKMADHYCDIYRASMRDLRDAGRMATGLAHQLQDQNRVRKDIENKLKSTMDMMTGTSAIFAPIILGMSIMMLGPISQMTGQTFFEDIGTTLTIYLVELAALIALMSSNLMCRGKTVDIIARFSLMMPISIIVFTACSAFSL